MPKALHRQIIDTAESAGFDIYGPDLLCRALAVIYIFNSEEFALDPTLHLIAAKGQDLMVKAHERKDIDILRKFRGYVRQVQECQADWLKEFCERFKIKVTRDIRLCLPGAEE